MKTQSQPKITSGDPNFTQLCVWPSITVEGMSEDEIKLFFATEFNVRVMVAEQVTTLPDKDQYGNNVPETGGRHDLFFWVHTEDIGTFAIPRLIEGIRWWEDVVLNGSDEIYEDRIRSGYPMTWGKELIGALTQNWDKIYGEDE